MILEDDVRAILALLPENTFLRRYVEHAESRTDAHLSYHLGSALCALAQTAPRQLSFPHGTELYTNIFALLVGPIARRKSVAVKIASKLLMGDENNEGPLPKAVLPGDIASPEGVQDLCARQSRFLIAFEEFGDFLIKAEQPQYGRLKTTLNAMFDASPAGRIRVNKNHVDLNDNSKNPRVSVLAACATEFLKDHTRRVDWTGGFFSRWLVMYPGDYPREYEVTPSADQDVQRALRAYLRVKADLTVPARLQSSGMTQAARDVWSLWYRHTKAQALLLKNPITQGLLERANVIALKIAMLIAWDLGEAIENGWRLSAHALVPALRITNKHCTSVARLVEEIPADEFAVVRNRLLNTIPFAQPIAREHLMQTVQVSRKHFNEHIATLIAAGYVRCGSSDNENTSSLSSPASFGWFQRIKTQEEEMHRAVNLNLWDPPRADEVDEMPMVLRHVESSVLEDF